VYNRLSFVYSPYRGRGEVCITIQDFNKTYLYAGIYRSHCSFSHLTSFLNQVQPFFKQQYESLSNFISAIEDLIKNTRELGKRIESEKDALDLMILEDLEKIRAALVKLDNERSLFDTSKLHDDLAFCVHELQKIGADVDKPLFDIIDKFPSPFDKFKWAAFCPDSEDEARYDIPKGIYFRKDSFRPYYTRVLLAHEVVHTISGKRDPDLLAMGLEEGLAEIIGSIYLGTKLVGPKIATNLFLYSRHSLPISPIWKLYLDHTRQAAILYKRFGIRGLVELLNRGRRAIHETENLILRNEFSKINLPVGDYSDDLNNMIDYLLLGFLPNYVLSPLKRYLVKFIKEGKNITEICEEAFVPFDIGKKAIEELSSYTTLYMIDNNVIQYSNADFYMSLDMNNINILRYSFE